MATPAEHLTYLRQKGYTPRCPSAFTEEETAILARYGHWLEALATGLIQPASAEQEHFLRVAHGEEQPETPFERIWHKLRSHQGEAAPSPPPASPGAAEEADNPVDLPEQTRATLEQLSEVRAYVEDLRGRIEAERQAVLQTVQAKLDAIDATYGPQLEQANQALAELEAEARAGVLALGRSVRAGCVQVIFYRGRVTWDSRGLAQYAQSNPEVEQFRKVGSPSTVVRYKLS
jgi:hypothetical protein